MFLAVVEVAKAYVYFLETVVDDTVYGRFVFGTESPVFGKVISGMNEIRRIAAVKTVPVDFPIPGVEVNKPVEPQVIETVELELYGETYPEPVRVENPKLPKCWPKL